MSGPMSPEAVLDYLLKNQSTLVTKVSELEKSSAVIAVEIRMLRELLEKQSESEARIRELERWRDATDGKSKVVDWIATTGVAGVVAVIVTFISEGLTG